MKPNFPVDIPQGAAAMMIKWPDLECSMIRAGMRCNNFGEVALIYPSGPGYQMIVVCQMCIDDSDDGWVRNLEQIATCDLLPWSK